jgi:hypothetical protein
MENATAVTRRELVEALVVLERFGKYGVADRSTGSGQSSTTQGGKK